MEQNQMVVQEKNGQQCLTRKDVGKVLVIGAAASPLFANAADFTLDTSTILTAVGVVLAGVTAVALAAVAIPLVIKGVKYLKAAF